jgi:hypothetical protein
LRKNLPKENNHPICENSPNLVTLATLSALFSQTHPVTLSVKPKKASKITS